MSSGPTSFAAKARAAEAAFRSRNSSRELDVGELPNNAPISLGAYTTFKPVSRSRGMKTWKASTASSTPRTSTESPSSVKPEAVTMDSPQQANSDEEASASTRPDKGKGRESDVSPHPLKEQVKDHSLSQGLQNMAFLGPRCHPEEWDPQLPPGPEASSSLNRSTQVSMQGPTGHGYKSGFNGHNAEATKKGAPAKPWVQPRLPNPPPSAQATRFGNRAGVTEFSQPLSSNQFPALAGSDVNRGKGTMDFDFRFPQRFQHTPGTPSSFDNQTGEQSQPPRPPQRPSAPGPSSFYTLQSQAQPHPSSIAVGRPVTREENREMLLKSLHGIVASTSARASNARTVMYDPGAARASPQAAAPPSTTEPFPALPVPSSSSSAQPRASASVSPNTDDLHPMNGPSEPLQWKDRPVEVFKDDGPPQTDAELAVARAAMIARSTDVYRRDAAAQARRGAAALQDTEAWWAHDGRAQPDLRAYLHRLADREMDPVTRERRDSDPDNARPPSAASDTANRMLIPLLATLHGYLAEPPHAQAHNFGSFAPVPEWCVDRSVGGLVSFFGEDWGAPPARVGRDPRYRPVAREPGSGGREGRYGGFEPPDWWVHGRRNQR